MLLVNLFKIECMWSKNFEAFIWFFYCDCLEVFVTGPDTAMILLDHVITTTKQKQRNPQMKSFGIFTPKELYFEESEN